MYLNFILVLLGLMMDGKGQVHQNRKAVTKYWYVPVCLKLMDWCLNYLFYLQYFLSLKMIIGKNSIAAAVCNHLKFPIGCWQLLSELVYDTIRVKRGNVTTVLRKTYKGKLMFLL